MKICIMRHGEAGFSASSDSNRALTSHGESQARKMGKWLTEQGFKFELGLVSPYLRAQQTLNELSLYTAILQVETDDSLVPSGTPSNISDKLMMLSSNGIDNVIIVSHLPLVGYLVNELCPDVEPPMFSTAAIACVNLPLKGTGTLEWFHQSQ